MRRCLIVFALFVGAGSAAAQDNLVATGEAKFQYYGCKRCHNATDTATAVKKGPHLHNLFGRKPGSLPDFEYSEAMVTFGRDKVWNETTLATFLHDPIGTVPDNKMEFHGIDKDEEVRALIAYLATFDPDGMAPQ